MVNGDYELAVAAFQATKNKEDGVLYMSNMSDNDPQMSLYILHHIQ